jgi:hypothetical protein
MMEILSRKVWWKNCHERYDGKIVTKGMMEKLSRKVWWKNSHEKYVGKIVTKGIMGKLSWKVWGKIVTKGMMEKLSRKLWWENCHENYDGKIVTKVMMEKLSRKLPWMCSTWKEMSLILWIAWGWSLKPTSPYYDPEARLHLLISLPFIMFAELWNGMGEKRNPIVTVHWWAGIVPSARWLGYRLCDRSIFVRFPT